MANADIIKALFIDYILRNNIFPEEKDFCIGQEVMYGINKFFADLVVISKNKLYAFEIKAYNDNFRRLEAQISNYRKLFDFVYVIITKNHLEHLKKTSLNSIGIFLIDNDKITMLRKAKEIKRASKVDILETIPANYLKKYFLIKNNPPADIIRTQLIKQPLCRLKVALLEYMKLKLLYKYKNFLLEKGEYVHFEDISILSLLNYSISK